MSTLEEMKEQLEYLQWKYEKKKDAWKNTIDLTELENAIWVLEQRIKEKIIINIRLQDIEAQND